jgi:hypothetical protein
MRDIEGIEEAAEKIRPHMAEFDAWFETENERFKALLAQDHGLLGRVLKCHLIVEHYLGRYLTAHYKVEDIEEAKLGFFQKAQLLPTRGQAVAFVKPGILRLNAIRNRFGHTLQPELELHDLSAMTDVLGVFRATVTYTQPVDVIEAFTTVACTALIVAPTPLQDAMANAFSSIRVR